MKPNYKHLTAEKTQILREETPFICASELADIKKKMKVLQDFLDLCEKLNTTCHKISQILDFDLFKEHYSLCDDGTIGFISNNIEIDALKYRLLKGLEYVLEDIANTVGLPDLNNRTAHSIQGYVDKITDQILLIEYLFYKE